jgi:hypothetical protein
MTAWTLLIALTGCAAPSAPTAPAQPASPPAAATPRPAADHSSDREDATLSLDAPNRRIIAIGDLHGDWPSARAALTLAGLIDEQDAWTGGRTIAVQVGDQLDRGDDEREILDALARLQREAREAGGDMITLLGNHEVMNVAGDLRYVTPGGFTDFAEYATLLANPSTVPEPQRGRVAAFQPGGPWALKLSEHPVVQIVGDNVFVHGGVHPEHVRAGLDTINSSTSAWMRGNGTKPKILDGDTAPIWSRAYSDNPDAEDCKLLAETLAMLGAKRMIVAHTPQLQGITSACADQVWRVDCGLADHYRGPTQALEIVADNITVLKAP